MLTRPSRESRSCPVYGFQAMISGKYKLRILWSIKDGPKRYGEIKKGLLVGTLDSREIAPRVLSRELKAFVDQGLITRKAYPVVPPKVEYRLTPLGRSLLPLIAKMHDWGARHLV